MASRFTGTNSIKERSFRDRIEVRAVYRNQDEPILTRMMDKESHWGYDNGLQGIFSDSYVANRIEGFTERIMLYESLRIQSSTFIFELI